MENKEYLKDGMRVFVVPVDLLEYEGLSIYAKMVYIVLRSFVNPHKNEAFPSYQTISKLGSMSRRKAIDAVQELMEAGLLSKELRFRSKTGKKIVHTSNLYTIQTPNEKRALQGGSARHAPPLVHDMHYPSAQHAPEQNHLTKPNRTVCNVMDDTANQLSEMIAILGDGVYSDEYTQLCQHNEEIAIALVRRNKTNPRIVTQAVEVWKERQFENFTNTGRWIEISNPQGFFLSCYDEAEKTKKIREERDK